MIGSFVCESYDSLLAVKAGYAKSRALVKRMLCISLLGKKQSKDLVIKKIRCNFATQIGVLCSKICVTLKF